MPEIGIIGDNKKRRSRGNSKLTERKVARIKQVISAGGSITAEANRHGVSPQTIYLIAKGETWRNVPPVGNLITRSRPKAALSLLERDNVFIHKRQFKLSNKALAEKFSVSESVIARAVRDAELVLAFRVQRLLLTSGGHRAAMDEYNISLSEAERLTSKAAASRIPARLKSELS